MLYIVYSFFQEFIIAIIIVLFTVDIESGRHNNFHILWGVANFSKIIKY